VLSVTRRYFGLRDEVSQHADNFARGFTEALIAYVLGRPFGFTDQDLADEIMKSARSSNYELRDRLQINYRTAIVQNQVDCGQCVNARRTSDQWIGIEV
jgi:hypothetical protein